MATPSEYMEFAERPRVLIAGSAADVEAGAAASGAWRLAESLAAANDVILAFPAHTGAQSAQFAVIYYNQRNLGLLARDSDAVIFAADVLQANPDLADLGPIESVPAVRINEAELKTSEEDLACGPARDRQRAAAVVPREDEPGEKLLVLRPYPPREAGRGIGHYMSSLRRHLREGGVKRVASRAGALIKRIITGKH